MCGNGRAHAALPPCNHVLKARLYLDLGSQEFPRALCHVPWKIHEWYLLFGPGTSIWGCMGEGAGGGLPHLQDSETLSRSLCWLRLSLQPFSLGMHVRVRLKLQLSNSKLAGAPLAVIGHGHFKCTCTFKCKGIKEKCGWGCLCIGRYRHDAVLCDIQMLCEAV